MRSRLIILATLIFTNVIAQEKVMVAPTILGVMQLKSAEVPSSLSVIPILPVTIGDYYFEARYNYDLENTVGLYFGKTLKAAKASNHSFTPQAGILTGDLHGASVQLYYVYETKLLSVNFQNQYSFAFADVRRGFYYNWTLLNFNLTQNLSAGVSTQFYLGYDRRYNDNGVLVSYTHRGYSFILFDFNFYKPEQHYLALGIQKTLTFKMKPSTFSPHK